MSTYKTINGGTVQSVASDPPAPYLGQVWYNKSTGNIKYRGFAAVGAWVTGGNLNTAIGTVAAFGTANDGVSTIGSSPYTNQTEKYNGTAWTISGQTPIVVAGGAGSGVSTSGMAYGGYSPVVPTGWSNRSFSFNGSSWTNTPNMTTQRYRLGGAGASSTSAIAFGGSSPGAPTPSGMWAISETYNGSWTNSPNMSQSRAYGVGVGKSATAALYIGGNTGAGGAEEFLNKVENFNGTWSTGPNLNFGVNDAAGNGTSTSALINGGRGASNPPNGGSQVELWNGTIWTTGTNMPVTKKNHGTIGGGSASATSFGGQGPPGARVNTTYEYAEAPAVGNQIIGG